MSRSDITFNQDELKKSFQLIDNLSTVVVQLLKILRQIEMETELFVIFFFES